MSDNGTLEASNKGSQALTRCTTPASTSARQSRRGTACGQGCGAGRAEHPGSDAEALTEACEEEGLSVPGGGTASVDVDWRTGVVTVSPPAPEGAGDDTIALALALVLQQGVEVNLQLMQAVQDQILLGVDASGYLPHLGHPVPDRLDQFDYVRQALIGVGLLLDGGPQQTRITGVLQVVDGRRGGYGVGLAAPASWQQASGSADGLVLGRQALLLGAGSAVASRSRASSRAAASASVLGSALSVMLAG